MFPNNGYLLQIFPLLYLFSIYSLSMVKSSTRVLASCIEWQKPRDVIVRRHRFEHILISLMQLQINLRLFAVCEFYPLCNKRGRGRIGQNYKSHYWITLLQPSKVVRPQ